MCVCAYVLFCLSCQVPKFLKNILKTWMCTCKGLIFVDAKIYCTTFLYWFICRSDWWSSGSWVTPCISEFWMIKTLWYNMKTKETSNYIITGYVKNSLSCRSKTSINSFTVDKEVLYSCNGLLVRTDGWNAVMGLNSGRWQELTEPVLHSTLQGCLLYRVPGVIRVHSVPAGQLS